ncbi:hypothetical protein CSC2_30950 [Clostridium zeae]|uniref:Phage tail tape measure protein domain-containing protein n=1 Tax=Clostridium zeae TaxID=2759022 RepID=A0ABQ1ECN1_9CLOT|nr:phage tail tape measure protein [Clostridium zeae]GFZ32569.1 hypothetical protein CSC2_30950 [Clostridium zeae]
MANKLEEAKKHLKEISEAAVKAFSDAIPKLEDSLKNAAKYSVDVGSKFEESMSKVQALSGAASDEIIKLSDKAKDMGTNTKFSANEVSEAFSDLAKQGWNASDMFDSIDGAMNIATVTGEGLADTAEMVSDSLSDFGLNVKDSSHFADILASSSNASNASINLMSEAFKAVSPTAGALKYSIEDTALAIGLMADAGIKGEDAGKSLTSILTSLSNPPKEATKALNDLGISLKNADGTMKPLSGVLQELRGKFSNLSDSQKESYAAAIAGKNGMDGFLGIINASDGDFNKLTESINNANGSAEKMGSVMNDNLNSKVKILHNSLETLGVAAYQKFQGPMKEAVDAANNVVGQLAKSMSDGKLSSGVDKIAEAFSKLVKSLSELIIKWAPELINCLGWLLDHSSEIAAGFVAIKAGIYGFKAVSVVQDFVKVIKGAPAEIKAVSDAMKVLGAISNMGTLGIIVTVIAALVAGFIVLWNTNEGFRDFIISAWTAIYDTAMSVWGAICTFFTETIPASFQAVVDFFAQIPQFFSDLWNGILTTILAWGDSVSNFFTTTIPLWINNIITWFGQLPYNIGFAIGSVLGIIVQWGIDTVNYLVTNVPVWINNIITWFSQLPYNIGYAFGCVLGTIVQWGADTVNYLVNNVPIWVNNIIAWFAQLPGSIWAWLVSAFNNIAAWGLNVYNSVTSNISSAVNSIIAWFAQLPGSIWNWLVSTINNLVVWGANMISQGEKAASDLVDSIENIIASLPDKMLSIGENIVKGIWDGISGMAGWIAGKVGSFASGVIDGFKSALGIHSPSRVMRDIVGINIVKGIGVGIDYQMPDLNKNISSNLDSLTNRMRAVVSLETYRNSANAINSSDYKVSSEAGQGVTNNNDNGVTQNITFNNPVSTPSETARAIKRVGRELAFG